MVSPGAVRLSPSAATAVLGPNDYEKSANVQSDALRPTVR